MNQYLIALALLVAFAAISLIALFFYAWSAKKTLVRGGSSWSAKDIPIKRKDSSLRKKIETNVGRASLLESISDQTSEYLNSEE
tara:strand:+ start:848 stop:1099 length:252 start_codon:yes stop_codon:yes gene_type:complete